LLTIEGNYVERLNVNDNVVKSFNILTTSLNDIIILMVQTKFFFDLYLTKFLDISAVLFVDKSTV